MLVFLFRKTYNWRKKGFPSLKTPPATSFPAILKEDASWTFAVFNELRSFRLPPVRLRLESIRLRTVCQFAYVLNNYCMKQLIHQLDVLSRSP